MEDPGFWDAVMDPNRGPNQDPKYKFHLHVHPDDVRQIWGLIRVLTLGSRLGYMSSISPDTMHAGEWEGEHAISVHCTVHERDDVRRSLRLGDRIFLELDYN